ncbi:MAG TPA: hypothetical protein VGM05_13110 [Planctomycetaceae bacterium]
MKTVIEVHLSKPDEAHEVGGVKIKAIHGGMSAHGSSATLPWLKLEIETPDAAPGFLESVKAAVAGAAK